MLIEPNTRIMRRASHGIGFASGDTMPARNGGLSDAGCRQARPICRSDLGRCDRTDLGRLYIRIPNKSPAFDPDWAAHGHMEEAVSLFERWARGEIAALPGATLEIVRLPLRTPLILIEVPGEGPKANADTVLLYGHLDKQPEMVGWAEGYGPWIPRLEGDKLYGRGGADDGYAMFGALAALRGLREQGVAHARCVVLIEACEESRSYDP